MKFPWKPSGSVTLLVSTWHTPVVPPLRWAELLLRGVSECVSCLSRTDNHSPPYQMADRLGRQSKMNREAARRLHTRRRTNAASCEGIRDGDARWKLTPISTALASIWRLLIIYATGTVMQAVWLVNDESQPGRWIPEQSCPCFIDGYANCCGIKGAS